MKQVPPVIAALIAELSPDERALLVSTLAPRPEPIAITGIGVRLPGGVVDPASLARLLYDQRDAISEVPRERWDVDAFYDADPDAPGAMYTRYGGFLDRVDGFDPQFFEISPREAARMDPQQRLLLEVAWEALEDAGMAPDALRRSPIGVFVGACSHDYEQLQARGTSFSQVDAHTLTGDLASVLSGRVSYLLGLEGPSLTVDTACSSSLVAIHLACESLRSGQCSAALAGGVNLILSPDGFVKLSRMRALSPEGRCRAFDVRANGYARGEGAALLVLRRLSDAQRSGDRIWAIVPGSAMNHDGRSAGLTAPNGLAQRDVVRAALAAAGVAPADVGYIEAHGTGTPLGDPIEMEALAEVFGQPRADDSRCAVGSIKTNIGHLEGAAGVAGVLKAIVALHHERIPLHLHQTALNPRVRIAGTPLVIPRDAEPWPRGSRPRVAGVSSFGISGTNAHVIVAEAPAASEARDGREAPDVPEVPELRDAVAPRQHLLVLSAKSEAALRILARRYAEVLSEASPRGGAPALALALADVARSANTGRARHAHRLAVIAGSEVECARALDAFAAGGSAPGLETGHAAARPRVAFALDAAAALPADDARRLYRAEPAFRQVIDDAGTAAALLDGRDSPAVRVATCVALAALWRAWGIEPDAVVGTDAGELAAACVAGALTLAEALALAAGERPALEVRAAGRIALVSGARGRRLAPEEVPVAMRELGEASSERARGDALAAAGVGCDCIVRVGAASGEPSASSASASRDEPLLGELARLAVRGAAIDWAAFHRHRPGRRVSVPGYPFARDPHWLAGLDKPSPSEPSHGHGRGRGVPRPTGDDDPLLGERLASPLVTLHYEARVSADHLPWPAPAQGDAPIVLPAALHLARALAASREALASDGIALEGVAFPEPLVLARSGAERRCQVALGRDGALTIASAPAGAAPADALWATHLTAQAHEAEPAPARPDSEPAAPPGGLDQGGFYAALARAGYRAWPGAQWVQQARLAPGEASASIAVAAPANGSAMPAPMLAIWHAALEVAVAAALADPAASSDPGAGDDSDLVPVPTAMFRVKSFGPGAGPWSASARALPSAPGTPTTVDVRVSDASGRPVVEAMGCKIAWRARSAVAGGLSPAERDLVYQVDWRPVQAAGLRVSPGGVWLVLADRTERAVADALVAALLEAGLTAFAATDASLPYKELTGVVDLRALAAGPEVLRDGLAVMHALLARTGARPRLWLVTRGAQAPSGSRAAQAGLWGLGRVLGCEYPEAWGGLIDLAAQPAAPRDEARLVLAALADHALGADREAAIQGGVLAVPRLERAPALPAEPVALRASATYLVTGGLGTLGLAWTRWLVRRGARHVVLAGRNAPGAAAREALAALASTGVRVRAVQADASSPADVAALWRRLDDGPPVAGILHAAGLTEDAALGATAWDSVARVLAPKLQGAANLAAAAAARPHPLDFFVGFSSIAALLGNRGQAGYAAANAALDAHIAELRARGVAAWSIAWGPFAANTRPEVLAAAQRRGIAALDIDAALAVFERLLAGPPGHAVVMAVDRARSEPPAGVANPALFAGWTGWSAAPPPAAAQPGAPDRAPDLLAQLAGATADQRLALLTDAVNATTRGVLALDPAFELSPEQRLDQLGLDSLLAIDLVHALGEALGTTLPTTLVLDHPSVAAIARYLAVELAR